jgi:hypothetical protein
MNTTSAKGAELARFFALCRLYFCMVVTSLLVLLSSNAQTGLVIDQDNPYRSEIDKTFSSFPKPTVQLAQTFTAGRTGQLKQLDLWVSGSLGVPLSVDLRRLSNSHPSDNLSDILGTSLISSWHSDDGNPLNSQILSLNFNVSVSAGETLAFVFVQRNGAVNSEAYILGNVSPMGDPYAGGELWTSGDPPYGGGAWYPNGNSSLQHDLAFRTFVETVPEPSPLALVLLPLIGYAVRLLRAAPLRKNPNWLAYTSTRPSPGSPGDVHIPPLQGSITCPAPRGSAQ